MTSFTDFLRSLPSQPGQGGEEEDEEDEDEMQAYEDSIQRLRVSLSLCPQSAHWLTQSGRRRRNSKNDKRGIRSLL